MRTVPPLLALTLLLAACATDGDASAPPGWGSPPPGSGGGFGEPVLVVADPGGPITEPGLSVADALGHQATDDLVTVTGALFANADGTVHLCDAIAESFPPQCGGDRILVEGLGDLQDIPGIQFEGEVAWAEGVVLFGSVE
jgi:hypothetical protein